MTHLPLQPKAQTKWLDERRMDRDENRTIFFTCILRSTITLLALKFRLYINTSLTLISSKRHISLRVMFFESLLFVCVSDKLGVHLVDWQFDCMLAYPATLCIFSRSPKSPQ
jgi:hypothetical protein